MKRRKLVRVLDWKRADIEQRMGFKGARFTDTNVFVTFSLGAIMSLAIYGGMYYAPPDWQAAMGADLFLKRGPTPPFIVLFLCWSAAILLVKNAKLGLQAKALGLTVVPQARDFSLAPSTARDILDRMEGLVDNPAHFVLLNRIERALSNLNNIGVISDVSEILRAQAENDEAQMESSYALVRGFVWSIPILGFIGTVLGLSTAIGNFGGMLAGGDSMEHVLSGLQSVTGGLSVAFDTTLLALVAALIVQLSMTVLKKKEEMFLDACKEYCQAYIVGKLRLAHLQAEVEALPLSMPGLEEDSAS